MSYSKCELDFLEEVRKARISFWMAEGDEEMVQFLQTVPADNFRHYGTNVPYISLQHYRESMAAYLKEAAEG